MAEEDLPNRHPGGLRVQFADAWQHIVGRYDGDATRGQHGAHFVADLGVSGEDERHPDARARQPGRVVPQHLRVTTVGATDEQHDVRPRCAQVGQAVAIEPPGRHVYDAGARRQPDPVAGLGGDQWFVPDDSQTQSASGRRADIHRRGVSRSGRG